MKKLQNNKGCFTLLEVICSMLVFSVLAIMALPRFTMQIEKSRASEGLQTLEALRRAQLAYYYENRVFSANMLTLDLNLRNSPYFNVPVLSASEPIISLPRNNNSYTLTMTAAGLVDCVPAGSTCGHLGYD